MLWSRVTLLDTALRSLIAGQAKLPGMLVISEKFQKFAVFVEVEVHRFRID